MDADGRRAEGKGREVRRGEEGVTGLAGGAH